MHSSRSGLDGWPKGSHVEATSFPKCGQTPTWISEPDGPDGPLKSSSDMHEQRSPSNLERASASGSAGCKTKRLQTLSTPSQPGACATCMWRLPPPGRQDIRHDEFRKGRGRRHCSSPGLEDSELWSKDRSGTALIPDLETMHQARLLAQASVTPEFLAEPYARLRRARVEGFRTSSELLMRVFRMVLGGWGPKTSFHQKPMLCSDSQEEEARLCDLRFEAPRMRKEVRTCWDFVFRRE